ncbi:MAG: DUF5930 domain-containing protein, partial [Roseobacter sp.]
MRTRLAIKINGALEHVFPERRVFLKSDNDARFIRLRPSTQLWTITGASLVIGWSIIATSILLMDSIGAGNAREQAKRDQTTYQARLNDLADQRDHRAAEALAAQDRFNAALGQISSMQSELLQSETRRFELETGIEVVQSKLRLAIKGRQQAQSELVAMQQDNIRQSGTQPLLPNDKGAPVDFLAQALAKTAAERDEVYADAQDALRYADEMALEIALLKEDNDQIFRQLEDAMALSVAPLDKIF